MKLKFSQIENPGELEKERIVLKVSEDTEVGRYFVFKTKKVGENVSSRVSDTFWFQDKSVKKDDWVLLYTKIGTYKSTTNDQGNTSHFFYWDKSAAIWTSVDETVVVAHADEWNF